MQTKLSDGSVMVCGTLPRDAEYKTVGQNGSSLTKFSVKVGEKPNPDATDNAKPIAVWCNCVCWHSVARAAKNLKKSDAVLCIGKVETRKYTGRDGEEHTAKELICEFVLPMVSVVETASAQASNDIYSLDEYEDILSDDKTPF
ncbi:MAG: single-stranded DNA-binding protein [Ruminococcus sp.]|nr:single-stranded DNA-binding protein [Ruminococcus sp.]